MDSIRRAASRLHRQYQAAARAVQPQRHTAAHTTQSPVHQSRRLVRRPVLPAYAYGWDSTKNWRALQARGYKKIVART